MLTLSKKILSVSPSQTLAITAKAKAMKQQGINVLSFAAGEPDFDTPDHIKKIACKAIADGLTRYTPAGGTIELKKAVCQRVAKNYNLSYTPENIVISCGAKHSIYNVLQVLCEEGDEVIIPSPYWVSYPEQVKLAGATPKILETKEENNFKINPEELNKQISAKTKMLILNTPSNPTGIVYTKQELKTIAEIAVKNKIYVLSDEIYADLIYDDLIYSSIAALGEDIKQYTILINGVSKSYAMTGWRIGYLAADPQIAKAVTTLQSHSTSNPTSIAQYASVAALAESQDCVIKMKEAFKERRNYLVDRLNNIPQISCLKPQGAFYVFPNISQTGIDSVTLASELLEKAHVAVVPGKEFGADTNIRLSYATSMKDIEEGVDRIEDFLKKR